MHRQIFRTSMFVLLLGAVVHPAQRGAAAADDPVASLASRLDLERYKATIKGLTAVRRPPPGHRSQSCRGRLDRGAAQELRLHRHRADQLHLQPRRRHRSAGAPTAAAGRRSERRPPRRRRPRRAAFAVRTGVNTDPMKQPDAALRALNEAADDARTARRRSTARKSARRAPTRCTSSRRTWTATAGAKRPMTMARARRW